MKHYYIKKVRALYKIECDCCHNVKETSGDETLEAQEYLQWEHSCGYNSIFGDRNLLELDLCPQCVQKLLGQYIKITEV